MKLHDLKYNKGSRQERKRVGRGHASGSGKTSGRGQKGQKARSKIPLGFEGGQTPFYIRIPKRGFTNVNRMQFAVVNIDKLNVFDDGTEVTIKDLQSQGFVKNTLDGVKILGQGELEKKLTVQANAFSNSALEQIEKMGGKAEVI